MAPSITKDHILPGNMEAYHSASFGEVCSVETESFKRETLSAGVEEVAYQFVPVG